MITWSRTSFLAQLTFFAASSALAQTSGSDLSADEVKALVTDKVWNITIGGGDPNVTAFWDFKADGRSAAGFVAVQLDRSAQMTANGKFRGILYVGISSGLVSNMATNRYAGVYARATPLLTN